VVGKAPISGGFDVDAVAYMRSSKAVNSDGSTTDDMNGWRVSLQNVAMSGEAANGYVYALCATVEGGFPNPGWSL
jgi:hypothetical protein